MEKWIRKFRSTILQGLTVDIQLGESATRVHQRCGCATPECGLTKSSCELSGPHKGKLRSQFYKVPGYDLYRGSGRDVLGFTISPV
ncbi:hypothetical protein J6590_019693 [Homalodisca vitripennis]|nr:hypothetical protein J6590_019693 [Homalodisca vitripennis]